MNREMLKKERQATPEHVEEMLSEGIECTLSINGDEGYPYGLPLNYVYLDGCIYMHTADQGYKIDALKANNKVCFSAITYSELEPKLFTSRYESVVATGEIEFIHDEAEKTRILQAFVDKYSPGRKVGGMKFIKAAQHRTAVLKMHINDIKGRSFKRR